jgi:hypothetical protein
MSRNGRGTTKTPTRRTSKATPPKPLKVTAAQLKAQRKFLEQFMREKEEAWARMTEDEKREAQAEWERLAKSINEGRYRKVILE